ncbi:MAG: tripartite tricarboxylate transporter substrate-binding protein [Rubrivivax sp.]|nr:tripartite tricarboxylate transporter substrate-binding protein [Rubrivivax sp.]
MNPHRRTVSLSLLLAALSMGSMANAQPAQTVVWTGFPAGGLGDQVTRPLLEQLKGRYPGTLILESKAGAGGRIAADFVKRAPADGATLLQVPSSVVTLYPHTYGKKLTYDPLTDFVAVAPLAAYTMSMTVGPMVPPEVKTVADFIRWVKANPDKANYGTPALGSAPHFTGMMFERAAGVALKTIPYKGGAPLLQDLLGGQIPVAFNVVSEVLPHLKSGRLRALAVASPQRWAALPEVPTMVELGYKDIVVVEFLGWYAPAKTSPELVRKLNAAVQDALDSPAMQEVFTRIGLLPLRDTPEAFAAHVKREIERWGPLVKATGFTPED